MNKYIIKDWAGNVIDDYEHETFDDAEEALTEIIEEQIINKFGAGAQDIDGLYDQYRQEYEVREV